MEDLTGRQFGPYQIVAPLGEGGMAAVYKAYQPATERYVALKVLPQHFASDEQFVARFDREAKLLAQLQHPYIVPVFDFGHADGYTFLVMPFVSGGTLTKLLIGQPLPPSRIRQVVSQVGEALNYAHRQGLIHRDVKPSNVLLNESGHCLLTDFGLAKMTETSINLTTSGAVVGTPTYMSPEQGSGRSIDARSDIYSLGIILYQMATGRVPYKAETPVAVIYKHIQDPLPPPRQLNPELDEGLERVILKSLSKRPEDRYQTAADMVRGIQAATNELPLQPAAAQTRQLAHTEVMAPPARPGQRQGQRRLWPWLLGGSLLFLLMVIGVAGIFFLAGSLEARPTPTLAAAIASSTVTPTPAIATATISSSVEIINAATVNAEQTATAAELITATADPGIFTPTTTSTATLAPTTAICPPTIGQSVHIGDNTNFWSEPNVLTGFVLQSLPAGTAVFILDGPETGPIRQDLDISGEWWQVSDSPGGNSLGWIWEGRIDECSE